MKCARPHYYENMLDVQVMINPLSLDDIRAMGIKIAGRYNLRSARLLSFSKQAL